MAGKRTSSKIIAATAFLAAAALGSPAHAQQNGMPGIGGMSGMMGMGGGMAAGAGFGMGGGMMMHGPMHQGMPGHGMMMGCFMVTGENGAFPSLDQRFDFMRMQLAINDTQKPQWDAWTSAVKRSSESLQASWQSMWANMMNMNFAERFGKQMEAMNQHFASMQQIMPALSALYAVLMPEQRTKADMMFAMMGCRG